MENAGGGAARDISKNCGQSGFRNPPGPSGQATQGPSKSEVMVAPSPVVAALVNGQEGPCLIDTGSEVTVMEYDFYGQRFKTQEQLDPCWLCLRAANNLPILVEGITWVRIQIEDQVLEQVGVVATHCPVNPAVPIELGINVLKDLNLLCWLAKYYHLGRPSCGCDLRAVWL